jgi:hypothetical protein
MNTFINAMGSTGMTYTENGALTHTSTGSAVVDLFFHLGAMRDAEEQRIINMFKKSLAEDPERTLRILFYTRDVRGGQGERRVFRILLEEVAKWLPDWLKNNLHLIPEYGRWDDMYCLLDTKLRKEVKEFLMTTLYTDLAAADQNQPCSLLAKWLPSENASSGETKALAKSMQEAFGMTSRKYRKCLSYLRKHIRLVEHNLTNKDYDSIDYSTVPSKAGMKYRKAFLRNDNKRYTEFIAKANSGNVKMNAATLYPYEIVNKMHIDPWYRYKCTLNEEEREVLNAAWKNLPDYVGNLNGLVVADTSGSMLGRPMDVSISLAMYIAERNKNEAFKDYFISFSAVPTFHHITGNNIYERAQSVALGDVASTNIQAVFDLILTRAKMYNVPQHEMPEVLYIVSDMEFDMATRSNSITNFERIKAKYEQSGYEMPKLVFWNVNSRNNHTPVTINDRGVYLISGCSPVIFKYATNLSRSITDLIDTVINNERYSVIKL